MHKAAKKNHARARAIRKALKKIAAHPQHYKPLAGALHGLRRVHTDGPFVIIFEIAEKEQTIRIIDYDHHDNIYES